MRKTMEAKQSEGTSLQMIPLSLIVRDEAIQPRVKLDRETVTQYAEDMLAGIEFPPIVVYFDGEIHRASQGFHRCQGAEDAGLEEILAEVRKGTREDAIWDAAGSNTEHDAVGKRRTNADKRRAVEIALRVRHDLSDSLISEHCGVTNKTVAPVRARLESTWEIPKLEHRKGADGKSRSTSRNAKSKGRSKSGKGGKAKQAAGNPSTTKEQGDESDSVAVAVADAPELELEWNTCARCGERWREEVDGEECPACAQGEMELEAQEEKAREEDTNEQSEEESPDPLFILNGDPDPKTGPRSVFNRTNEMVEWAPWTWNPVTGCKHSCVYCYARDIANRFYKEKFEPTFHPERLKAPYFTSFPSPEAIASNIGEKNVFVCSMADLFGKWVPDEWIDAVMAEVRNAPQWNFLFLTKFPLRYEGIKFPQNAWVGTSVDEQNRIPNAEKAFRKVKASVKWLSCEPIRERLTFTDLKMFDWVVMGGQSKSTGAPEFQPPWEWVEHLWGQARAAGAKVYWKPNLKTRPREYPGRIIDTSISTAS